MRFASRPDTMALFEPPPKTLYRIQPENGQSGIMTNFVFNVIETKMYALTSVLLPREMLSYEPEVLLNG